MKERKKTEKMNFSDQWDNNKAAYHTCNWSTG